MHSFRITPRARDGIKSIGRDTERPHRHTKLYLPPLNIAALLLAVSATVRRTGCITFTVHVVAVRFGCRTAYYAGCHCARSYEAKPNVSHRPIADGGCKKLFVLVTVTRKFLTRKKQNIYYPKRN